MIKLAWMVKSNKYNMYTLVLVRHGESEWNKKQLFCGWTDVGLTNGGKEDAKLMGEYLATRGLAFEIGFTSVLKRAGITLEIISEQLREAHMEIVKDWRLNERHYGKLQGQSKVKLVDQLDWRQVHAYRRSYSVRPPELEEDDPRHPRNDERYREVDPYLLPGSESLEDTYKRVIPYFQEEILPSFHDYKNIIISSHGNTLRVIRKYLDKLSNSEIEGVEFGIGEILIYTLSDDFKVQKREQVSIYENPKHKHDL